MTGRTRRHRQIAGGLAVAAVVAAISLGSSVATAVTQTKNYNAAISSWTTSTAFVGVADSATVTLTNELTSNQTFGSAELSFDSVPPSGLTAVVTSPASGWTAKVLPGTTVPGVVQLTSNKNAAIGPGGSVAVKVTVTPTAAGTVTIATAIKQSNTFLGTGNDFVNDGAPLPPLTVVALSLAFAQQPSSSIPQSVPTAVPPYFAYFCPPVSVQLYNGAAKFLASGVPVTIKHGGASDPGLYFGTTAVGTTGAIVHTDSSGVATFGSCPTGMAATGLAATVVGTGYTLSASSPAASSAVTSNAFQVTQTCNLNCTNTASSNIVPGTTGTVTATGTGIFQLFTAFGQGVVLSCDSAITKPGTPVDPLVVTATAASGSVSGTLTIVFPKSVVNSLTNNGTPQLPVCAGSKGAFPALGGYTGSSTDFPFQGLLYNCDDPAYIAARVANPALEDLCVLSRAKVGGGAEQVVIRASNLTDPSFW